MSCHEDHASSNAEGLYRLHRLAGNNNRALAVSGDDRALLESAEFHVTEGDLIRQVTAANILSYSLRKFILSPISYLIPSETGDVEPGKRLLNWLWYFVVPDNLPEMSSIFTDVSGTVHPNTVPRGLVNQRLWADQVAHYQSQMTAPLAEVVSKTPCPFITRVGEAQIRQASFFNDRLMLVGDAFTAFRSHMGLASEQAALHCWQMDRIWRGEILGIERRL